jgi:hypothetical protein
LDRLSIPATEALQAAEREAAALGHRSLRVVHVLLGLASTPGGAVRRAMLRRGVLADELRAHAARLVPPDDGAPIELTRTPLERLVQLVRDDAIGDRPLSTVDLLRAVLAARDDATEALVSRMGGGATLLFAAAGEEAAEPEPAHVRLPARVAPRDPVVVPAPAPRAAARETVSDAFEVLLEIRAFLRALAQRQADGVATPIEVRVAADIEAAVASARLRMAEDRRGGIGSPRADELAQRRFASTLRSAYLDALGAIAGDLATIPGR